MKDTRGRCKDEALAEELYLEKISYRNPVLCSKILLLLHGSYACNCSCIYCENGSLRSEYKGVVISEELVREVVQKLGPILKEVTWHGGEPLLLPENLLEALEDEKSKLGFDFVTSLQTNSILYSEKKDLLDRLGIRVGTSFDGLNNDGSRGKNSTEAILSQIASGSGIGFIAVTYDETIDLLIDNYEYFKSLGVPAIQSCIVRENVIEESNPYLVKNDVAVPKMLEYIDYWIHDRNNPIYDSYVDRQIKRVLGTTSLCEDSYCLGGWLIMDPFGNLNFCGHSPIDDPIVNISDIRDYKDLLSSTNWIKSINKQKKLERTCSGCQWYEVCHGACMGLNYECDHSYNTINSRNCEYNRLLLEGIYEMIKDIDISRRDLYNPMFIQSLEECNYYSLSEIKAIEGAKSNG